MTIYKVKGKMIKHKLFMRQPGLIRHLPETHWYTASHACRMLKAYHCIYMKPDGASGVSGIIKVRSVRGGYEIMKGEHRTFTDSDSLYSAMQPFENTKKKYIVQRGIALAHINGNIFDVRMYMQRPGARWLISGMAARVAARNHYVTNAHQGGYAKTLKSVLLRVFRKDKTKVAQCIRTLRKISFIIARVVNKRFPDTRELGIDLGIESSGRVWIIEANTRPKHRLFTQLSDPTMFRKIRRNKRIIRLGKGWSG